MATLIDNYTATGNVAETPPRIVSYRMETRPFTSSSLIFDFKREERLNQRIIHLLNEYAQLEDNWDEEDGKAPCESAIKRALFLTKVLDRQGQQIFHAAPGPNGEIMLDIRNRKKTRSLEIIFYADNAVSVLFPETGKPSQQVFAFDELPRLLHWLNQQ